MMMMCVSDWDHAGKASWEEERWRLREYQMHTEGEQLESLRGVMMMKKWARYFSIVYIGDTLANVYVRTTVLSVNLTKLVSQHIPPNWTLGNA